MSNSTTSGESTVRDAALFVFLAGRDMPCPQCNYNLRDLTGNRCPECGEVLVLRVGLHEPKQGLLIAGLVGLSAVAGFNGIMLAIGLAMDRGQQSSFNAAFGIGLWASAAVIFFWLHYWRRIRRLSTTARIWLVIVCWLLPLIDVVILLRLFP